MTAFASWDKRASCALEPGRRAVSGQARRQQSGPLRGQKATGEFQDSGITEHEGQRAAPFAQCEPGYAAHLAVVPCHIVRQPAVAQVRKVQFGDPTGHAVSRSGAPRQTASAQLSTPTTMPFDPTASANPCNAPECPQPTSMAR